MYDTNMPKCKQLKGMMEVDRGGNDLDDEAEELWRSRVTARMWKKMNELSLLCNSDICLVYERAQEGQRKVFATQPDRNWLPILKHMVRFPSRSVFLDVLICLHATGLATSCDSHMVPCG